MLPHRLTRTSEAKGHCQVYDSGRSEQGRAMTRATIVPIAKFRWPATHCWTLLSLGVLGAVITTACMLIATTEADAYPCRKKVCVREVRTVSGMRCAQYESRFFLDC